MTGAQPPDSDFQPHRTSKSRRTRSDPGLRLLLRVGVESSGAEHRLWAPMFIEGMQGREASSFMSNWLERQADAPALYRIGLSDAVYCASVLAIWIQSTDAVRFVLRTLEPFFAPADAGIRAHLEFTLARLRAQFPRPTEEYLSLSAAGRDLLRRVDLQPLAESSGDLMMTAVSNLAAAILCHFPAIRQRLQRIFERLPSARDVPEGARYIAEQALGLLD
jgi:hypothetical protein